MKYYVSGHLQWWFSEGCMCACVCVFPQTRIHFDKEDDAFCPIAKLFDCMIKMENGFRNIHTNLLLWEIVCKQPSESSNQIKSCSLWRHYLWFLTSFFPRLSHLYGTKWLWKGILLICGADCISFELIKASWGMIPQWGL